MLQCLRPVHVAFGKPARQDRADSDPARRFLDNARFSEAEILGGHVKAPREHAYTKCRPIPELRDTVESPFRRHDLPAMGIAHRAGAATARLTDPSDACIARPLRWLRQLLWYPAARQHGHLAWPITANRYRDRLTGCRTDGWAIDWIARSDANTAVHGAFGASATIEGAATDCDHRARSWHRKRTQQAAYDPRCTFGGGENAMQISAVDNVL